MTWSLVKTYSFTCDHPNGCDAGYEGTGHARGGGYWAAVWELQLAGWQVRVLRRGRTYYCPLHRER